MKKLLLLICLLTLDVSCAIRKNLSTPFAPPANAPAVDDGSGDDPTQGTTYCRPDANGKFDDTGMQVTASLGADGNAVAIGGGCVIKPIREAWATINNVGEMKWDAAQNMTSALRVIHPDDQYTHLYTISYAKTGTPIGEVDWTMKWYHGFDKGTFLAPGRVNINYGKSDGSGTMPVWTGGVVLTKVNNNVTGITIKNVFRAIGQSSDKNMTSAHDALAEIIRKTRTVTPDWSRLNTGLKDNPDQPDPPPSTTVSVSDYCVKDANGKYPAASLLGESNAGVSSVKLKACLPVPKTGVDVVVKNPLAIKWLNATTATVGADNSVSYKKPQTFGHNIQWTMNWDYSKDSTVSYGIYPATNDFPVWNGSITYSEIEPNVTEIEIDNQLLTDVVSKSLAENELLINALVTSIVKSITDRPYDNLPTEILAQP